MKPRAKEFQRLLTRADATVDRWRAWMEPWKPPGPRRYYPARTLRTIELHGSFQVRAGIHLLRRGDTAYAAEACVRALAELFAHAAWILGTGGLDLPTKPRVRALCFEYGMARALVSELDLLATQVDIAFSATYLDDNRRVASYFRRLHASQACTCGGKGRSYRDVGPTLHQLATAPIAERIGSAVLIYGLWRAFSRGAHFPRLERIAAAVPGGARLSPATLSERAADLINLLVPYSLLALWSASVSFPPIASWITGESMALHAKAEEFMS